MLKSSLLFCAAFAVASAQPPSPFQGFSSQSSSPFGGGSFSSSPFGGGSHSSSPFGGGSHSSSPFGGGSHSSSPFGGGSHSSSPFGHGTPGPPSSSPFSFGGRPGGPPPGSRPGFPGPAGYKPRPNAPSKLFSWLGSTMAKLPGLVPKVQFHSKQKPSSPKAPQTYFSGPPRESLILPQIPNSIYETGSSPFGDSSISFAPSHSGPIKHSAVNYRNPSGPPPSYSSRPGPPPSFASRPSFSSRPPPSFSSGPPPPSYLSSSQYPSESPFSSSSNRYTSPPPQGGGNRDGLEVFPSRQVSYQSQTLSQNQAGYDDAINGLQNLYGSQSSNKPSYEQGQRGATNYEQQSSYSQSQPQVSNEANYGAAFHNIEPVRVAPMFDIQNFRASAADMSGAASNSEQKQQGGNIHDTPFVDIVNQYSAHADAATAGSDQMISAMGNSDMVTAASSNVIRGVQILGQGNGNPVFEVLAGPNAPTYDGHPVDLSKLISMIEPGAEIDTVPQYGEPSMGAASEQQPVYAEAPSNIDLESEAAMSSGGFSMSGNKKLVSGLTQVDKDNIHDDDDDNNVHASASESRPTVVKPDGTRLTDDEKLIKEHFEKEIILDDNLQDDSDKGFIIVRMRPEDDETGHGNDTNRTLIDKDDLLAIVQQLRNSANFQLEPEELSVVDSLESPNKLTEPETEENDFAPTPVSNKDNITSSRHPNHNYNANSPNITLDSSRDSSSDRDSSTLSPVINPIFDSVRPNITASAESVRTEVVVDDQDYPDDDMIVETDGDLAASASRNVKSVAIIVTPPPYYVKIKNKYKKVNPPVSSLTLNSSPPTSSVITPPPPPPPARIISGQLVNESSPSRNPKATNNASNSSRNSSIPSAPTTVISRLQVNESIDSTSPSISAVSSISSGRTISDSVTNNGTKESNARQAPRYPVYRGKSSV